MQEHTINTSTQKPIKEKTCQPDIPNRRGLHSYWGARQFDRMFFACRQFQINIDYQPKNRLDWGQLW